MRILLFVAAWSIAAAALAQGEARRSPADPQAPVPAVQYRSAFDGYQPFHEPALADWRRANEEMKRLGGHPGHAPQAKPPAAPAGGQEPQSAAPGGHGGHK
jgi:hypothetical protein